MMLSSKIFPTGEVPKTILIYYVVADFHMH